MRRNPPTGSAITSAMIAGVVIAFGVLATIVVIKNLTTQNARNRLTMARDALMKRASDAARQPANITKSAEMGSNALLNVCALRSGASDCNPSLAWQDFDLYDSTGTRIAGSAVNPVRYDLDMQVCATASQKCPFEARSEFKATCAGGAGSCDVADLIDVRTEVRVAPTVQLYANKSQVGLKSVESVNKASPTEELRRLSGREVAARGAKTCEAGLEFRGLDEYGRPVCKANANTVCGTPNSFVIGVDFKNSNYSCAQIGAPSSCGDGYYFGGWNPDGSPVCWPWAPIIDNKLNVALTVKKAKFDRCPVDTVSVGLNPDGSNLCEPMHLATGNLGKNGPAALGINTYLVAVPWTPFGARCSINFDNFVGGSHSGLCTCDVVSVIPGSVTFQTSYSSAAFVNPAQHACGFAYFIWGSPNESGP